MSMMIRMVDKMEGEERDKILDKGRVLLENINDL